MSKVRKISIVLLVAIIVLIGIAFLLFHIANTFLERQVVIAIKEAGTPFINHEIRTLSMILEKLPDDEHLEEIRSSMSARLELLENERAGILSGLADESRKFEAMQLIKRKYAWQYAELHRGLQFLTYLKEALSEFPQQKQVSNEVGMRLVGVRMLETLQIALYPGDDIQKATSEVSAEFFVANDAYERVIIKWRGGGGAFMCTLRRKFPPDALLLQLTSYYSSQGWKPLKYDLCQPIELGGLEGGWRTACQDPEFWTQFWARKSEVVNVNITYYDKDEAQITIMHSVGEYAGEILDYYYMIHGADDNQTKEKVLQAAKKDNYRFIPIRTFQ